MGRAPCCDKVGLKKGPWSPKEDQILINFIQNHGHSNWRALPKQAGLLRCGKSCRLRWINYLKPDIKRGNFTKEEEVTIIQLHEVMGSRWSSIAARLPGRTDNEIKNVWHTHLKKRLAQYQNKTSNKPKIREAKHVKIITKSTTSTSDLSTTSDQVPTSSQQSYSSATFWSNTEVSSIEVTNYVDIVKNEPTSMESQQSDEEYYQIIDETFWSSEDIISDDTNTPFMLEDIISDDTNTLFMLEDNNNMENLQLQQSLTESYNKFSSSFYVENDEGNYGGESMDFWSDVYVKAGDKTELPEF